MSTTLAYAQPRRAPHESEQVPRHIEVVSTARQRRARPRIVYALVAVAGLFVILMAQLLLSIVLSNGAYQISALQVKEKNLARDQQTLSESLRVLQSPQNLAGQATNLGMVMNSTGAGWLRLSDGAVLQGPTAAGSASAVDAGSEALITNSLLTPEVLAAQSASMTPPAPGSEAADAGAPAASTTTDSVASGTIPSPTTH